MTSYCTNIVGCEDPHSDIAVFLTAQYLGPYSCSVIFYNKRGLSNKCQQWKSLIVSKAVLWPRVLQDFVHHFHVLLHRDTSPTKSGIRDFFRRIHLPPAGYQVGNTMVWSLHSLLLVQQHFMFAITAEGNGLCLMQVFLREAERQRLQTLLHQEVLRRIVNLQRRFRAVLERKHFVNMRRATCVLQVRFCGA